MVTNMLNANLIRNLVSLQIDGRMASPSHIRYTYCSDGSCVGDCVGGCDGTPAGGFNH